MIKGSLIGVNILLILVGIVSVCVSAWMMYIYRKEVLNILRMNNALSKYDSRIDKAAPLTNYEQTELDSSIISKRGSETQANHYSALSAFFLATSGIAFGLSGMILASLPYIK